MRIYFSFSAAIAKTAKLKQERHNTVHVACQTANFGVSFPVGKRVERLVQYKPLFMGFLCLETRRGGGRPQGYVRERLVVVIRSF
jgi:hypothetical protein